MSEYRWGTFYLVHPGWDGNFDDGVVDEVPHGPSHIDVATELLRLVGEDSRASLIDAVVTRAHRRDPSILEASDLDELIGLLEGLEQGLVGSIVDADWNVRPDQLDSLRLRTSTLDLGGEPVKARAGVGEGMGRVGSLRNVLARARAANLHVAL